MTFEVHTAKTAPEGSRSVLESTEKKIGFVPNLLGVLAESPAALQAYSNLSSAIQHNTGLSSAEQQVIFLAVSFQNRCAYCVAAHSSIAGNGILTNKQIESLRNGSPLEDERLEALRRLVVKIVESRGRPSGADLEEFLAAGYKKRHILDILAAVALKTLTNYTNEINDTDLDDAFAGYAWTGA